MSQVAVPVPLSRSVRQPYFLFHVCDLDAPAVAVAWQWLFAHSLHVSLRLPAILALAVSVWLIYAGDRLLDTVLDSGTHRDMRLTVRHEFHWRHRRTLTLIGCLACLSLVSICLFLRPLVLYTGIGVGSLIAVYMSFVHLAGTSRRSLPSKEMTVGLLFAIGTCLAPLCGSGLRLALVAPALLFAALCWFNCAAIEVWEWDGAGQPESSKPHRTTIWLSRHLRLCLYAVAGAAIAFACLGSLLPLFAAICVSSLLFLWVSSGRWNLRPDILRVLVDLPLLSPLLLFVALHRP